MTAGYPIEVFGSDEDEAWVADVHDLPFGAVHGATPHDAVAEVDVTAEAWIEAAKATGRPVPKPSPRVVRA